MSTLGGGSRYQLPKLGGPERDPGPYCTAYVLVFPISTIICRGYKLPLSDQAPSHSETESQSFRFNVKIFSRCFGGGGGGGADFFFPPGPEPNFGSPGYVCLNSSDILLS